MSPQTELLDEMKGRVEKLWQSLIYARSDEEKERLRSEYLHSLQTYERQRLIVSEHAEADSTRRQAPRTASTDPGRPNPFDYADYRDFLLDWFRHFKDRETGSLLNFSRETGLTPEQVVSILKRSKRLDPRSHSRILRYLSLPAMEEAYLDALYYVSEAESKELFNSAMKRLTSFALFRKKHPEKYEAWRYLSHWFYVVIREMTTLPAFREDAQWIQRKLRMEVPIAEIRQALAFLKGAGFYRTGEDGRVESLLKYVNCAGGLYRIALGQFHREMLHRGADSIENTPPPERLLLGHTVALPRERRDQAFRILTEAMEKIRALGAGEDPSDEVFHIELIAFPLTGPEEL